MGKIKHGSSYESFEKGVRVALKSLLTYYEITKDNTRAKEIMVAETNKAISEHFSV